MVDSQPNASPDGGEHTPILLVGAGPIGLELAVALRHVGAAYCHLEAGAIGQTILDYPAQTQFFSSPERIAIAGVPLVTPAQAKATREEYLAYLRSVVQQFGLPIRSFERVVCMTPLCSDARGGVSPRFEVQTQRVNTGQFARYTCDHLVLAIGDMHEPNTLGIPGEALPFVRHQLDDPHRYFGQRLLIVGGKNSAVEAALRCHRAGAVVTISYRRQGFDAGAIKYWLLPEIEALVRHGQIRLLASTEPVAIGAAGVRLRVTEQATDRERHQLWQAMEQAGDTGQLPFDFVLLLTGFRQDASLFRMAGVELAGENQAPVLDRHQQTSVPGLYVAGTAAAGTQRQFRLFIENCHPHVDRIVRALTGVAPPAHVINQTAQTFGLVES